MATSLAAQLKRLATPQTKLLTQDKKRPSFLFDPKEAATKDRETIYEIGISGLAELKLRNPKFELFESTLFSFSSKGFERSVQSKEANQKLDKNIKRFLLLLSPHFLQPAAHKCLEWLINRFHIHDYNKNELFMLILPYHETRYFARCVQLMDISDNTDRWNWLHVLQKAGAPLSKTALLNRCACDNLMLKFVCDMALESIKELENRSNTLTTMFAFYCTSLIGALEYTKTISETQVTTILPSLLKSLSSEVKDFVAAGYMIIAQLVIKTKLSKKLLEQIVYKVSYVQHISLRIEAVLLLVLIYQTQKEVFTDIPTKMLNKLTVSKWFPLALGQLVANGSRVLAFLVPLLKECLTSAQTEEGDAAENSKALVQNLLTEVKLEIADVEPVVRCLIDSFICKTATADVIVLDSDSEDEMETDQQNKSLNTTTNDTQQQNNAAYETQSWYCDLLKTIENQYPEPFDNVVKTIMRSKRQNDHSKTALKNILGLLPNTSHGIRGNTSMFENLYSHNPKIRLAAVKYIVAKSGEIDIAKNELLRNSLVERLGDESPQIYKAALKLKTEVLLTMISWPELQEILMVTLNKCHEDRKNWWTAATGTLKVLCSRHDKSSELAVFKAVFPFVLPVNDSEIAKSNLVLKSKFGNGCEFLRGIANVLENKNISSSRLLCSNVFDRLESIKDVFDVETLLTSYGNNEKDLKKNCTGKFLALLLVTSALQRDASVEISSKVLRFVLDTIKDTDDELSLDVEVKTINKVNLQDCLVECSKGKLPVQILVHCLDALISKTDIDKTHTINFSDYNTEALYFVTLFEKLITSCSSKNTVIGLRYAGVLKNFFAKYAPSITETGIFISNFFTTLTVEQANQNSTEQKSTDIIVTPELQLRSLRLACSMFNRTSESLHSVSDSKIFLQNVLIAMTSRSVCVRKSAVELVEIITTKCQSNSLHHYLFVQILGHKSEILLDHEQLPLVLYITLSPENTGKKSQMVKNDQCLLDIYEHLVNGQNPLHLTSAVLKIFTLVNSDKILSTVSKLGSEVLRYAIDNQVKTLDEHRSSVLQNIINRINRDTIKIVTPTKSTLWSYIMDCLSHHGVNLILDNNNDNTCFSNISVLLMDQIDNEIYSNIPKALHAELISSVIDCATDSENPSIITSAGKFMKRIEIDARLIQNELQSMRDAKNPDNNDPEKEQRRRSTRRINVAPSPALLTTKAWKRGITLLEFVQNKKKIQDIELMLPMVFDVLKRCLDFDIQAPVEYTKQLLLTCILHCCNKLSTEGGDETKKTRGDGGGIKNLPENTFNIELVVQCIRATSNPQTHHHALMVLSRMAGIVPEQVLHNMMAIFTFMGSSVLRHDDAYSFQIITKLIETVIPILVECNTNNMMNDEKAERMHGQVTPLLRVFVGVLLDIPEHRRIPLFKKLLDTLGAEHFLWSFLALVFEAQVLHSTDVIVVGGGGGDKTQKVTQRRLDIAGSLMREYPPDIVILSCNKLVVYLKSLPVDKDDDARRYTTNKESLKIFDYKIHTAKQLRHYKYTLITFLSSLLSSPLFVSTLATIDDLQMSRLEQHYKMMIVNTLTYIQFTSKVADRHTGKPQAKYWKVMLHHTYDILDSVNGLLSADMFLSVTRGLMAHALPTVRRKAMELLINRLQHNISFFDTCRKETLYDMVEPLRKVVESINVTDVEMDGNSGNVLELQMNQQTALLALKLLSRLLGPVQPLKFKPVLDVVTDLVANSTNIQSNVLASVVLCLAELCNNLGSQAISSLSKFMPSLINVLKSQQQTNMKDTVVDLLLLSTVTALHKIVESLALFLSPYLEKLLVQLAQLDAKYSNNKDDDRNAGFTTKLQSISTTISSSIAPRVLIPAVKQSYDRSIKKQKYQTIGYTMRVLSESFTHMSTNDFQSLQTELTNFFLEALQFRGEVIEQGKQIDKDQITRVETCVIDALVNLILKLSESSFKPLYYRLFDWASTSSTNKDRSITFYRLSERIAGSLKGLFILFAGCFVDNACKLLDHCNIAKCEELYFPEEPEKCAMLIESIVKTLHAVFLYDSHDFVNKERFELMMRPLVDQLENNVTGLEELRRRCTDVVIPCLGQFAVATGDDSLWKQLNYQVLLKTRHASSEIRLCGLDATCEIARRVGEDFLPLLPETIPFLAELLEDEDTEIESSCQRAVQELEVSIGEPLQKYF